MRASDFLTEEQGTKLSNEELKAAIDNNQAPPVKNSGWSRDANSFGDLEELGYMTKETMPAYGSIFIVKQVYTGPGPVTLVHSDGREEVISKGWSDETEVDYS